MGRHVWLRTPTKIDRKDILDLYIGKVAHEPELDEDKKRDELARITGGYSPAMLEQVCSMALTYAHADGRERFDSGDILEAMTTVESGTAVNIEYPEEDTRAVALHESGHAAASHVYMKGTESTRISIRMRGESLGHHQAAEQVEHFSQWRSDQMATLIWGLGAMAAERVFYGQTTSGVGGDIQTVTRLAALMVGAAGMGPEPFDLGGRSDAMEEERVLKRFEEIGLKLMNRTGSIQDHDVAAGVLMDRDKRSIAAQLVGQAYVTAHNFVRQNRTGIEKIADEVVARSEIYGDDLVELLDGAKLSRRTSTSWRRSHGRRCSEAAPQGAQQRLPGREPRRRRRLPGRARPLRDARLARHLEQLVVLQAEGRRRLLEGAEHGRPRGAGVQVQRRADRGRPGAAAALPGRGRGRDRVHEEAVPQDREPLQAVRAVRLDDRVRLLRQCAALRFTDAGAQDTVPMLRRETLELALYTFKYSPSVKSIVGLLPPTSGARTTRSTSGGGTSRRSSRSRSTRRFPEHKVLSYQQLSPVEKATVDRLTMKNTYQSPFSQGANGRTLLVLRSIEQ